MDIRSHVVSVDLWRCAVVLLVLLVAPGTVCAQQMQPSREPDGPWRTLLAPEGQVDLTYRIGRINRGNWINSVGLDGAFRLHVIDRHEKSNAFGLHAGLEQWFGIEPAPRRILVGTTWEYAGRSDQWRQPGDDESPLIWPACKGYFGGGGLRVGIDYARSYGLGADVDGPNDPAPQDGIRASAEIYFGAMFFNFEPGAAVTMNFDRLTPLDVEAWFHIAIGRPLSPFSGHFGYKYHSTGRFEVHYFSAGLRMVF